jgi:hypothetical protein
MTKAFLLIWVIAVASYIQGAYFNETKTRGLPVFIAGALTGIAILTVAAVL